MAEAGLDEALGVFLVHGGAAVDDFEVFVFEGSDLAGDANDYGVVWDAGVLEDDGPGADDAVVADFGVFEEDGVDANHDVAADAVAVEDGAVGDDDVVAYFQIVVGVKDAVVLDVGVASDADASVVAAEDGAGPDAGVFAYGDVADDVGGLADKGGGVNFGGFAVEGSNHVVVVGWVGDGEKMGSRLRGRKGGEGRPPSAPPPWVPAFAGMTKNLFVNLSPSRGKR